MLVKNWMSKPAITIEADASIVEATNLLKENHIHQMPVVTKGKMVGIITDRDLKRVSASDANTLEIHELLYLLSKIKVKKVMTRNPVWVPADHTVEEAAKLLIANKISSLPVVDPRDGLVGIITRTDLLKVLVTRLGVGEKGIEFSLLVEDRPGAIQELINIVRKYGGRIDNVLRSHEQPEGEKQRRIYLRMYGIDRHKLPDLKAELRTRARMAYMVDHRENIREIYE